MYITLTKLIDVQVHYGREDKSSFVDSEHYLLTCMRYIELNPVRANMVEHPGDNKQTNTIGHTGQANDWRGRSYLCGVLVY